MRFLKQIDHFLARAEAAIITLILSLMILMAFGQVLLRNFFNQGILWGDIFLRQMVLWVGFLGASLAAREGRHIAIDFLPNILPSAWRKPLRIFSNFCAAGISVFLAAAAWTFVGFEKAAESVLFLNLPVWIFQTILPYSFCLLTVRFLLKTAEDLFSSGSDSP